MTASTERRSPGAAQALGWGLLNTFLSKLGTLGIGIVLARLLGPESFGTYAVALVALTAVLSFNELGVSLAVVRWPSDPARIVPVVNTISVLGSAIFCSCALWVSPYFAAAMGDPEATDVVRVLVLSVFINGVVASPAALLQRDFKEKKRLVIDQVNVWVGAILSLLLALAGMGAMALAVGRVAGSLISGIMFLIASPLPYRFGLDRTQLLPLLRFGLPLAGTSIIFFAVAYADQLTAGALLGATGLAFYVLAFNLSSFPVSIISQPLRRVAPAAFSVMQDDRTAMGSALISTTGLLAAATLPTFVVISALSQPLLGLVYGSAWLPASAALSWLVMAAASRLYTDLAYDFLAVLGRSGTLFIIQASSLAILVPALAAGAFLFGLPGLAAAQALVSACVLLPLYLRQLARAGVPLRGAASALMPPMLASVGAGALAYATSRFISQPVLVLVLGGAIAVAASIVLLYLRRDELKTLSLVRRAGSAQVVPMKIGTAGDRRSGNATGIGTD